MSRGVVGIRTMRAVATVKRAPAAQMDAADAFALKQLAKQAGDRPAGRLPHDLGPLFQHVFGHYRPLR